MRAKIFQRFDDAVDEYRRPTFQVTGAFHVDFGAVIRARDTMKIDDVDDRALGERIFLSRRLRERQTR